MSNLLDSGALASLSRAFRTGVRRVERRDYEIGLLGKRESNVWVFDVPGDPAAMWVRIVRGDDVVSITKAYGRVAAIPNTRVKLRRNKRGQFVIEGADDTYVEQQYGAYAGAGVQQHATNHRRGGGDGVVLDAEQVNWFRVSPAGYPYVRVSPGWYRTNDDALVYYPGELFQVSGSLWASSGYQRWALLAIDTTTNRAVGVGGTEYPLTFTLDPSYLAAITPPANSFPIAGIRFRELSWRRYDDFVSLWRADAATGVGGGAPTDATYIVQTPSGSLSNEQALSALATGLVKNTTGTGVLSIAAAGTDYAAAAHSHAAADVTSGVLDNARVNFAAPGAIGTTTPAAGNFTALNAAGPVVINDAGADADVRIEGDTNANLLVVDASLDAIGIGTATPDVKAILDVSSTTKGFLPPSMTGVQRLAMGTELPLGLMVLNRDSLVLGYWRRGLPGGPFLTGDPYWLEINGHDITGDSGNQYLELSNPLEVHGEPPLSTVVEALASSDMGARVTIALDTVPVNKGGTGQTTTGAAFAALAPSAATGQLLKWDGSAWVPTTLNVATANMRQCVVLYDNTLGANGAWAVSSISQDYDDLELLLLVRGTVAAPTDVVYVMFNGDTVVTNYHQQVSQGVNGANASTEGATPTIAFCSAGTAPAAWFTPVTISIPNYASTLTKKIAMSIYSRYALAENLSAGQMAVAWDNTAAINRIFVRTNGHATDLFATGSRLRILGYKTGTFVTGVTLS